MHTNRTLIMALCLAACSSPAWAAEAADSSTTRNWAISPYADLQAVYDDNIERAPEDEIEDTFFDATAGLRLGYAGSAIDLLLGGFVMRRSYLDTTDKNFTAGGQNLQLQTGNRESVAITLNQSLRRVEDTDIEQTGIVAGEAIDVATRSERTVFEAGIRAGRDLTDKTGLDAGYNYSSVEYEEEGLLTLRRHTALLEGSRQLSDKSDALLLLQGSIQEGSDEEDDTDSYAASLGLRTQQTDKLQLRATVGVQQYNRADGDNETSVLYGLQSILFVTDKLSLLAAARNGTQRSSVLDRNDIEYMLFSLGARLAATRTVNLTAQVDYREDDYLDPVLVAGIPIDRTDEATAARLRVNYQTPSDILQLYAAVAYESVDSDVREYDQTRTSLGLRLQF